MLENKIERDFELQELFKQNFKNPAMEKLKSLRQPKEEKIEKVVQSPAMTSRTLQKTGFRRNSKMIDEDSFSIS